MNANILSQSVNEYRATNARNGVQPDGAHNADGVDVPRFDLRKGQTKEGLAALLGVRFATRQECMSAAPVTLIIQEREADGSIAPHRCIAL